MANKKTIDYQALKSELDAIMQALQQENIDVDQALKYYQRGLELVKALEKYLKTAENRVSELKVRFSGSVEPSDK